MKIIITKQQYKSLVYSLLDTVVGGELTVQKLSSENYKTVYDSEGENIMKIFSKKGSGRNKGCKNDLGLDNDFVTELQKYVPYFKNKIFSEALVDYVYEKTGIKCDCIDYSTGWVEPVDSDGNYYGTGYYNDRFAYNVKKKKKIRFGESVDDRQSLDEIIYDFLKDDFYPDYDWGPELFDFYDEEVRVYGSTTFHIDDSEAYIYYDDGTLEIMPWVCEKLNEYFNDSWYSVFKSWFEKNSGLKVDRIVDSTNNNELLQESIDKNKKFLKDSFGVDFTNSISLVTSTYDVPMSFDECLFGESIRRYMNLWGPIFLFELDGLKYLYQNRGEFEWFMDEHCNDYVDNEIIEKLGIGIMGLTFSDIIDMYFEEEEY
jgi:hypothetical protein